MRRRHALIASTLAVAVLLVGCGGDDDSSDEGSDTTEETTTTAEDEATEETTESTETTVSSDGTETTTTIAGGGDPDTPQDTTIPDPDDGPIEPIQPSGDLTAWCAAYDTFDTMADTLPNETLEDIRTGSTTLRTELEGVRAVTPPELVPAVDTLINALVQLEQIAAQSQTIEEAQASYVEAFGEEDAQNAAELVDATFSESCPQANDEQAPAEGE